MRKRTHRSREAVPVTHPKRTVIRFPRGMIDGRIARCVDASGSPKYEYDERFTTLHFTPQEFRQFIRCLDDAGSPSTRRARELALQQYRSQGGPNVGGLEYRENPVSGGMGPAYDYSYYEGDRVEYHPSRRHGVLCGTVIGNKPPRYGYSRVRLDGSGGVHSLPDKKLHPVGAYENPTIMGLSGTDVLLFLGGAAAVGLVGYLVYKQQQAAQSQANALTSPELSYAATDINPPPPAVPVPPPPGGYPGTSPLPVPPS